MRIPLPSTDGPGWRVWVLVVVAAALAVWAFY